MPIPYFHYVISWLYMYDFYLQMGLKAKEGTQKNKLSVRKCQGFAFFTFANLCIPTLIPFKYLESIKYLPYINTYVIYFSFNLIPRIIYYILVFIITTIILYNSLIYISDLTTNRWNPIFLLTYFVNSNKMFPCHNHILTMF